MIIVKALLAVLFGAIGLWFWRVADEWSANGEIPKDWVESVNPEPVDRDDLHFQKALTWQKAMAALWWFFAGLFVVSIGLELAVYL